MAEQLNINDDVKILKLEILSKNLKQNWNLDTDLWNEEFPHDYRFEDTYLQLSFVLRDFNMNELVLLSKKTLEQSELILRIPKFLGLFIGHLIDIFSNLVGRSFSISLIRIKKFTSNSQFDTSIQSKTNFKAPFDLKESLTETIKYEFLEDNSHKQTFETE